MSCTHSVIVVKIIHLALFSNVANETLSGRLHRKADYSDFDGYISSLMKDIQGKQSSNVILSLNL